MLLVVFLGKRVLPLEFKPEQEAAEKGGVQQLLAEHFAKVYRVSMPLAA